MYSILGQRLCKSLSYNEFILSKAKMLMEIMKRKDQTNVFSQCCTFIRQIQKTLNILFHLQNLECLRPLHSIVYSKSFMLCEYMQNSKTTIHLSVPCRVSAGYCSDWKSSRQPASLPASCAMAERKE